VKSYETNSEAKPTEAKPTENPTEANPTEAKPTTIGETGKQVKQIKQPSTLLENCVIKFVHFQQFFK
jgi:hypothetical protein